MQIWKICNGMQWSWSETNHSELSRLCKNTISPFLSQILSFDNKICWHNLLANIIFWKTLFWGQNGPIVQMICWSNCKINDMAWYGGRVCYISWELTLLGLTLLWSESQPANISLQSSPPTWTWSWNSKKKKMISKKMAAHRWSPRLINWSCAQASAAVNTIYHIQFGHYQHQHQSASASIRINQWQCAKGSPIEVSVTSIWALPVSIVAKKRDPGILDPELFWPKLGKLRQD